jgi:alpha-L-rhamnosidase
MHVTIAGLAPAEAGDRTIRFAPQPDRGLTRAWAEHESLYGRVAIDWYLHGDLLKVPDRDPDGNDRRGVIAGRQGH